MSAVAKLSQDDLAETIEVAREYLQGSAADAELIAKDFAEVIIQLSDVCVVGLPCERHGGAVHGQEAEELRAGIEQILRNTSDVRDDDEAFALASIRKSLLFLLDRIDARDSLAFLEAAEGTVVDRGEAAC